MTNVTVLYCSVADLQQELEGTDGGIGTAAQLNNFQLNQAITSASNIVSAYAGNVFDVNQNANYTPPVLLHDLTLDLATWYAWTKYLKAKNMSGQHPIVLRYNHAMKVLGDVRDGKVRIDPDVPGSPGGETGHIRNPLLPAGATQIFSMNDSNTRLSAFGDLEADTPADLYTPRLTDDWDVAAGSTYQG